MCPQYTDAPTYVIVDGRTRANLNAPLSGGIKMKQEIGNTK